MAINIFILDNGLKYEFWMNRNDHSSIRHKLQLPNIFQNFSICLYWVKSSFGQSISYILRQWQINIFDVLNVLFCVKAEFSSGYDNHLYRLIELNGNTLCSTTLRQEICSFLSELKKVRLIYFSCKRNRSHIRYLR